MFSFRRAYWSALVSPRQRGKPPPVGGRKGRARRRERDMVGAGARGAPLLPPVLLLPLLLRGAAGGIADSVVWAVNAGGDAHVDVNGIHFRKDPLEGRVGRGEGRGHAAAGGFRRDSPRAPSPLRLGCRAPLCRRGPGPARPRRRPARCSPGGSEGAPQDGGGSSPPATRGRSWPEGSAGAWSPVGPRPPSSSRRAQLRPHSPSPWRRGPGAPEAAG